MQTHTDSSESTLYLEHGEITVEWKFLKEETHQRFGKIQEEICQRLQLMIYGMEYTEMVVGGDTLLLGTEDADYCEYFDEWLEKKSFTLEDITRFVVYDRRRDAEGKMIKENVHLDNYKRYLVKKDEEEYSAYFDRMVQEEEMRRTSLQNPLTPPAINLLGEPRLTQLMMGAPEMYLLQNFLQELVSASGDMDASRDLSPEDHPVVEVYSTSTSTLLEVEEPALPPMVEVEEEEEEVPRRDPLALFQMGSSYTIDTTLLSALAPPPWGDGAVGSQVASSDTDRETYTLFDLSSSSLLSNQILNLFSNPYQSLRQPGYSIRYQFSSALLSSTRIGEDVKVSLTQKEYDEIPQKSFHEVETESTQCIICNDAFQSNDLVKITSCKHFMHDECLKPWLLKESKKCPVCRLELGRGHAHLE